MAANAYQTAAAYGANDAAWDARLHQLQDTSAIGKMNNAFQRNNLETNYNDQLAKMKLGYSRSWEGFQQGLGDRGMLGSGIAKEALGKRQGDFSTSLNDLARQKMQAQGQLNLNDQGLDWTNARGQGDIANQRAAQRNAIAANLPSVGGW